MSLSTPVPLPPAHPAAPAPRARSPLQAGLERTVALLLVVGFYYCAYRYPFKINATTTSPTYSNTPAWLAAGKYVMVLGVLLFALVARAAARTTVVLANPAALVAFTYLMIFPVVSAAVMHDAGFAEAGFYYSIPLVLSLYAGAPLPYRVVNRGVRTFLYVALVVEAVQVFLFVFFDRLPALGYAKSISVRFGSVLDDPNGFALLLPWLAAYAGFRYRGVKRAVLFTLIGACLVLSQSVTGLVVMVAACGVFALVSVVTDARSIFKLFVGTLAVCVVLGSLFVHFQREIELLFHLYMRSGKSGSVNAHGYALELLAGTRLVNYLGLEPTTLELSETAYVNILAALGVPYLMVYLAVGCAAVWKALRLLLDRSSDPELRAFAGASLALLISIYVGSLALPVNAVFPVNMMGVLCTGLLLGFRAAPARG